MVNILFGTPTIMLLPVFIQILSLLVKGVNMKVITNSKGRIKCLCFDSLHEFNYLDWRLSSSEKFGDTVLYHFEFAYSDELIVYLGFSRSFSFDFSTCKTSPEIATISFGVRYYLTPTFSREIGLRVFGYDDVKLISDSDATIIYNRLCSRLAK